MNFYNQVLDKKGLKRIVSWFIENYGPTRTSLLLDDFKYIGFHYAGKAGLSLGFDDLRIPAAKKLLLTGAQKQVQECEKTYLMGRITAFERYQKLIDIWTTTSEKLKDEVIQNFQKIQGGPLASPLYMMAFSGARGNISQVRQLVGMRGLMSDSGGGIIDFPIRSNFREGLSVTEYVISCYGARKGLIDTALRTADSGYLTRRLVDVAHGIIIREIDCGTSESILMKISDKKNIIGRVLAESIKERTPTIWKNQEISPNLALELKTLKGSKASIQVRSPLTCLSQSVCQLCYGWNLAQGRLVALGDAVGILAAQSIGEPGTQLTMRTFHTGGIFSTEVEDKIYAPAGGTIWLQMGGPPKTAILSESQSQDKNHQSFFGSTHFSLASVGCKIRSVHGQTAFFFFEAIQLKIEEEKGGTLQDINNQNNNTISILQLPAQSILFITPGKTIAKNTLCAEISKIKQPAEKNEELTSDIPTLGLSIQKGGKATTQRGGSPLENDGENSDGSGLAQKKVFSEIQGEVVETDYFDLKKFTKPKLGGGNEVLNPLFEKGLKATSPKANPQPKGEGYKPEIGTKTSKARLVLAGEPFSFKRTKSAFAEEIQAGNKSQRPSKAKLSQLPFRSGDIVFWKGKRKLSSKHFILAKDQKSPDNKLTKALFLNTLSSESNSKDEIVNGKHFPMNENDKGPNSLRIGKQGENSGTPLKGEAFGSWLQTSVNILKNKKGTENSSGILTLLQKKDFNQGGEQSSLSAFGEGKETKTKPWLNEESYTSLTKTNSVHFVNPSFEIRKTNLQKKFIHENLSFSGLVLEFSQQKEQRNGVLPTRPSRGTLRGLWPSLSSNCEGQRPPRNWGEGHRPQGETLEGQRPPPNWGEGLVGRTTNRAKPNLSLTSPLYSMLENTFSLSHLGKILQPYTFFVGLPPAINVPTQIIRKRLNKLILRRVQTSLGGQFQGKNGVSRMSGSNPNTSEKQRTRYIKERDLLFQLVLPIADSASSGDIVQGLPKIEQLFEARSANESSVQNTKLLANKTEKKSDINKLSKQKEKFKNLEQKKPQEQTSVFNSNVKGLEEKTSNGPHNSIEGVTGEELRTLVKKTELRELQKRLIQEIQSVYNSQGVEIADKHLEIIVRQMTSRVRILEKGNTPFYPDDIIEAFGSNTLLSKEIQKSPNVLSDENSGFSYEWILLGITKVALLSTTESYISAASFQETKRVLMTAALQSRVDFFEGLKENVIVGRMIPAGTGYTS
uniref:DNA-directed RNA polymerase n=1 Tax=Monomastix sp. (strain OKE-1) TaxID=141716 RepID=C0JWJ8_MONSK|nr:beta'' subunit of RNA polymerase [Monomastix sp. OKE-1]ACK36866.1 beta'' subunit of RNA polymerase [Monomastix sp. OKE-1]